MSYNYYYHPTNYTNAPVNGMYGSGNYNNHQGSTASSAAAASAVAAAAASASVSAAYYASVSSSSSPMFAASSVAAAAASAASSLAHNTIPVGHVQSNVVTPTTSVSDETSYDVGVAVQRKISSTLTSSSTATAEAAAAAVQHEAEVAAAQHAAEVATAAAAVAASSVPTAEPQEIPQWLQHCCRRLVEQDKTYSFVLLDRRSFDRDQMEALAIALQKSEQVTYLKLSHTVKQDPSSIMPLFWIGLPNQNSIKILHLFCNKLMDKHVMPLAQTLALNSSLSALYLDSNWIGNDGAAAIATGLSQNTTLEVLDLSYNCIGDAGCYALANALRKNRHLRKLHLGANPITVTGALALETALRDPHCGLETLDLGDSSRHLPQQLVERIKHLCDERKRFNAVTFKLKQELPSEILRCTGAVVNLSETQSILVSTLMESQHQQSSTSTPVASATSASSSTASRKRKSDNDDGGEEWGHDHQPGSPAKKLYSRGDGAAAC